MDTPKADSVAAPPSELDAGRRRFTWAALIAIALTAVPFVWILWSLWGSANPLRLSVYEDNFYDLQARAMFHGRLSLPSGSIGIEGFVHDGRTYTYFGLFPSIIRMPILLVTSSLDGRLTGPSMLLAWLLTGLFVSLLLWRVRYLVRGDSAMGRAEATGFGVLIATLMGGTTWMVLAATPFVFNEDIAWSICLTVGSIFVLLGVMERPSWRRVIASGVFILCANLDRSTTGWACAIGAGLVALWFLLGLGGRENRRWWLPVLAAGVIPLVIGCAVNYSKFGVLFGVSNRGAGLDSGQRLPAKVPRLPPRRGRGHGLRTDQRLHLFSSRRSDFQPSLPIRHAADRSSDRIPRGAVRPVVPDSQPSGVLPTSVPAQYLGSRDGLSTQGSRQGGTDPPLASGQRERRGRPDVVGLYRSEISR